MDRSTRDNRTGHGASHACKMLATLFSLTYTEKSSADQRRMVPSDHAVLISPPSGMLLRYKAWQVAVRRGGSDWPASGAGQLN
jgi:hypothetical protein